MARVERREQADEQDEDENSEEGEGDVVAAETPARERPRALAFDLGAALLRRQLGGGIESEFLLAGGRHECLGSKKSRCGGGDCRRRTDGWSKWLLQTRLCHVVEQVGEHVAARIHP